MASVKKCPMCGSAATDDAAICFECLYSFDLMSCVAMPPIAPQEVLESASQTAAQPIQDPVLVLDPRDYEIVVQDGEMGLRRYPFDSGSVHVGRLPTNDVVLNDKTVSRRHLHIFLESGEIWVEDFGPANPAKLNGAALMGKTLMKVGDVLQVRSAILRLENRA